MAGKKKTKAEEKTATTNAERQAKYRQSRKEDSARLNMVISSGAKGALERLARYRDVSLKTLIEQLAEEAEAETLKSKPFLNSDGVPSSRLKIYKEYYEDY